MTTKFNLLDPLVRRAIKNGQNPDVARKWERTWFNMDQAKAQLRALDTAPSGGLSSQERRLQQVLRRMVLNDEEANHQVGMPTHPSALQALTVAYGVLPCVLKLVAAGLLRVWFVQKKVMA